MTQPDINKLNVRKIKDLINHFNADINNDADDAIESINASSSSRRSSLPTTNMQNGEGSPTAKALLSGGRKCSKSNSSTCLHGESNSPGRTNTDESSPRIPYDLPENLDDINYSLQKKSGSNIEVSKSDNFESDSSNNEQHNGDNPDLHIRNISSIEKFVERDANKFPDYRSPVDNSPENNDLRKKLSRKFAPVNKKKK